jgi:hypothetical protein
VLRLWQPVAVFRLLSAIVLVLGVVAAAQLSGPRAQQRTVATQAAQQDDQRLAAEREHIAAVSRANQRAAQFATGIAASASTSPSPTKVAEQLAPSAPAPKPSTVKAPPPTFGPIPGSCSEYTGNVAIGCALMLDAGYGLDQMPCLKNLWMRESGWKETSGNSRTGAYGIPQALPGSKMSAYGADWQTNPATQIKWGLAYIKGKYSTPCGAWSVFQSKGYY